MVLRSNGGRSRVPPIDAARWRGRGLDSASGKFRRASRRGVNRRRSRSEATARAVYAGCLDGPSFLSQVSSSFGRCARSCATLGLWLCRDASGRAASVACPRSTAAKSTGAAGECDTLAPNATNSCVPNSRRPHDRHPLSKTAAANRRTTAAASRPAPSTPQSRAAPATTPDRPGRRAPQQPANRPRIARPAARRTAKIINRAARVARLFFTKGGAASTALGNGRRASSAVS